MTKRGSCPLAPCWHQRNPRGHTEAQRIRRSTGRRTIVFIDEIHRFNKAQQDAFLPSVEAGDIVLIGATTENPSFEVNAALLSRSKVFVLRGLTVDEVAGILTRALRDRERGLGTAQVAVDDAALHAIALYANGDARSALNLLELSVAAAPAGADGQRRVDKTRVEQTIQRRTLLYDKSGEEHHNLISALHKSMRNSDPDASVYWLARMVEAGEDPSISRAVSSASPLGTSETRTARSQSPSLRKTRFTSACRKATRRSRKRPSTWRRLRRATRSTGLQPRGRRCPCDIAAPVPLHETRRRS
jgi:replication-associated recombination protein RarA